MSFTNIPLWDILSVRINAMKITIISVMALLCALPLLGTAYAGEIFLVSPGVQNQAMGNTGLSYGASLAAGWWNPALLGLSTGNGVELMRSEHFEGLMQQNQLSAQWGDKTRVSVHLNHLAIDKVKLTQLEDANAPLSNSNRPMVWKTVSNNDLILSGSFARKLGESMAIGLSPKLAYRDLAGNSGYGFGADLGFYWDNSQGLMAGANLRDFFSTQILWENGTHEIAIPNLDMEIAYLFKPLGKDIPVRVALRSQVFAEDRGEASNVSAGAFSADLHAGLLVSPIPTLNVMAGWDVDAFTAGLGVRWGALGLDYAYKDGALDALGNTQR